MNFIAGHHIICMNPGKQINPYTGCDHGLKCCLKSLKKCRAFNAIIIFLEHLQKMLIDHSILLYYCTCKRWEWKQLNMLTLLHSSGVYHFKKKNANEANKLFKYYEEMFFIMDIRNFRWFVIFLTGLFKVSNIWSVR